MSLINKEKLLSEVNDFKMNSSLLVNPVDIEEIIESQPTINSDDLVKQKWISVKDRLPNEEEDVIVLVREIEHYGRHKEKRKAYHWIFTGWFIDGKWATNYCHGYRYIEDENEKYPNCVHTVSHWMPLPQPPKMDGGKNDE